MNKKEFTVACQKIKQAVETQMTLILASKGTSFSKVLLFFQLLIHPFSTHVGMGISIFMSLLTN